MKVIKLALSIATTDTEKQKLNQQIELSEKSCDVLLNPEKKAKYLRFLFLNYTCSQPQSIEKLINDYHFQVFPYYTFNMYDGKVSTEDAYDLRLLILDFINLNVTIYNKHEVERIFMIDVVEVSLK